MTSGSTSWATRWAARARCSWAEYPNIFAAVAAEAPAAFWQTRKETMQPMKDAKVPVMIVHGDIDEFVPVTNSRAWVDVMKELKMDYEFVEAAGHQARSGDRIRPEAHLRVLREA